MNVTYLKLEIRRILRSPQFALFTIGMPLAMYLLFGGLYGSTIGPDGVRSGLETMAHMAAYGASTAAFFTGTRVAVERTDGWQRQLRLTPMRGPGYLLVKVASAMAVALPVILVIFVGGALRGEPFDARSWALMAVAIWLGALPFTALGVMIGLFGRSDTVGAVSGAMMLPFGMLGGLWIPLYILPSWLSAVAHAMPTYWLGRVGLAPLTHDTGLLVAVLVLAAWLVLPGLVVMRRFRLGTARV